jgi:hypothetical protein
MSNELLFRCFIGELETGELENFANVHFDPEPMNEVRSAFCAPRLTIIGGCRSSGT